MKEIDTIAELRQLLAEAMDGCRIKTYGFRQKPRASSLPKNYKLDARLTVDWYRRANRVLYDRDGLERL